MKYIKTYENMNTIEEESNPQLYDYVWCLDSNLPSKNFIEQQKEFKEFTTKNVGRIVQISYQNDGKFSSAYVTYENIPKSILEYGFYLYQSLPNTIKLTAFNIIKTGQLPSEKYSNVTNFDRDEILFFSPDKEYVEEYVETQIALKKYNI